MLDTPGKDQLKKEGKEMCKRNRRSELYKERDEVLAAFWLYDCRRTTFNTNEIMYFLNATHPFEVKTLDMPAVMRRFPEVKEVEPGLYQWIDEPNQSCAACGCVKST